MQVGFEELGRRLLHRAREAVRRGEVSERTLAKLCGYSQPHMHNVLAGVRGLQPVLADRLLAALELPLVDLCTQTELSAPGAGHLDDALSARFPLLEGTLGGGRPLPRQPWRPRHLRLPGDAASGAINPAAAFVSPQESAMWPTISPGDLVLLDRSTTIRRSPTFGGVYAVYWRGKGYLRRCQRVGQALIVAFDQETPQKGPPPRVEPGTKGFLEVVRGRVVWLARDVRATEDDEG